MAVNTFVNNSFGIDSPAQTAAAVTPNDGADLAVFGVGVFCRALYIGGDGNITLVTVAGDTVVFVGLVAGTILPVATSRVKATGTTATNIVALG